MSWDIGREQWDREPELIKEQQEYEWKSNIDRGLDALDGIVKEVVLLQQENARLKKSNRRLKIALKDILQSFTSMERIGYINFVVSDRVVSYAEETLFNAGKEG